jgi:PAS domain S-box-containing protein
VSPPLEPQASDPQADAEIGLAQIAAGDDRIRAEGAAAAKVERALVDAGQKLRLAEEHADATLDHALIDAGEALRGAAIAAEVTLEVARIDAEEKLRDTQLELARQRRLFERFFTLSPDMMCIMSADLYFERVSPAVETLGYTEQDLIGKLLIDFVHPDDVQATAAECAKLARQERIHGFDNRYCRKDGAYRWLSWTVAPDASGTLYAIARDITESKRSEEALASAKIAADDVHRELESFSYSVAHDLQAPLRSIDGFSQALLEDYADQLDENGRTHLRYVRESAQLMAKLIDDLLTLSRVSGQELIRGAVDLSAIARATCARLAESAPDRIVELIIQDGVVCRGDAGLLAAALENLLGNAWKFTRKQSLARIEFGVSRKDGHPVYFVQDNGAGFDMAHVDKLFGAFQRLHATQEFEGSGVGLATVRRIVHRHGGRVWAEGQVDAGATFRFTLDELMPST